MDLPSLMFFEDRIDILLEKIKKLHLFLVKHCNHGGALPCESSLRETTSPCVSELHMEAILQKIQMIDNAAMLCYVKFIDIHEILNTVLLNC